jgi:hypothetical protein
MRAHSYIERRRTRPLNESGIPVVAVVQTTQAKLRGHLIASRRSNPLPRCLLTQPEVRSVVMIIS